MHVTFISHPHSLRSNKSLSLVLTVVHLQDHAKKVAEREAWQAKYNKEERKKRYVAQGLAEKQKQKRQRLE